MENQMYAGVGVKDKPGDEFNDLESRSSSAPNAPFHIPTQFAFRPMTPTPWGRAADTARSSFERPAAPSSIESHLAPAPDEQAIPSTEQSDPRPVRRAYGPEGKWFPTFCCHDIKYSKHPHHHRLNCGHDVVTSAIEVCGSNCAQSRDAESKVTNKAFACPFQSCKVRQGATLVRRKGVKPDRPCTLSHVYGLDRTKDEARVAEKESAAVMRKGGRAVRKRSESPPATEMAAKATSQKKRKIATDADSEATQLVNEPGVMELMKRINANTTSTTNTRRLRGNRLETKAEQFFEGATTRAAAKLQNIGLDGQSSGGIPAFAEPTERRHPKHPATPSTYDAEYPEQVESDTFCVCETTNQDFLVPCDRCERGYHPGCLGYGSLMIPDYTSGTGGMDALLKVDHDKMMAKVRSGEPGFHCPQCKTVLAAALASLRSGVRTLQHNAAKVELQENAVEATIKEAFGDKIARDVPTAARADPAPKGLKRKAESVEVEVEVEATTRADSGIGVDGEDVVMDDAPVARPMRGIRRSTRRKAPAPK